MNLPVSNRLTSFFKEFGIYFLIFAVVFSLRIFAINNKTSFFFDDPASFSVSTPNNLYNDSKKVKYGWADLRFDYGRDYNVLEIKKTLFRSSKNPKGIWNDLVFLHNKTLDTQHPNLYYSILRIWTAGIDYSDSHSMIARGCSLNLIFFMFSYFFMFKLLNLIKKDKSFVAIGLFFSFITTGSISNTLLIRPYPLVETGFILTLYIFLTLYKSIEKESFLTLKKIIKYTLGIAFFLLTAYYSLLLAVFIFITLLYKSIQAKNYKMLFGIFTMFCLAFFIVWLFCPLYFINFASIEHMNETKNAMNFWNLIDFHTHGKYLTEMLSRYVLNNIVFYMILFALAIIGLPVFNNKSFDKDELKNFTIVYVTTMLYTYLVVTIAPFNDQIASMRYIMPFMSVIGLIWAFVSYYFRTGHAVAIMILTFATSFFPISQNINMLNSPYKNIGVVSFFTEYHWLDFSKMASNGGKLIPVIITNRNWIWPNFILYFDNNTTIRFEEETDVHKYNRDKYLLINSENAKIIKK